MNGNGTAIKVVGVAVTLMLFIVANIVTASIWVGKVTQQMQTQNILVNRIDDRTLMMQRQIDRLSAEVRSYHRQLIKEED